MSRLNLRRKPRISYCELEDLNLDEYIFCDKCNDYVYEYCSIHGALLVIPDDKVPAKPPHPACVPHAAHTVPHVFLHLAPSVIPGAGVGVFTTLTLPRGVRFGPYRGQRAMQVDSMYCWQIYDRNNKPAHVVDAADPDKSNWMRYVNCARHWSEQNLVAFQYQGHIYYRTIKIIPRFTELLVYYGSEFAHALNVDVHGYNSPPALAQKYGAPAPRKRKLNEPNGPKQGKPHKFVEDTTSTTAVEEPEANVNPLVDTQTLLTESNELKPKSVIEKTPEQNFRIPEHFSQKPHSCHLCDYKCSQKSHLKTHLLTHSGEKPHSCHLCDYKCSQKSSLKIHLLTHSGQKPHSCHLCRFKCSQKSHLKTHLLTHSGQKPHSCHLCHLKCSQKSHLKTHLLTHSGEKPHSCHLCDYKCSRKSNLKTHLLTHSGQKPHSCHLCSFRCSYKSSLKIHLLTHSGEKPHSCHLCDFKCSQKSDLKRHSFTHSGEKPHSCHLCDFRSARKSKLNKHMLTHGKDDANAV